MVQSQNLFFQFLKKSGKTFSKAECRIIDYIVNNPHEVVYLSLAKLAERTQTSDVTIIRLCKKIDLSGYPELRIIIAQSFTTLQQPSSQDIKDTDSIETVITKEFQSTLNTLQATLQALRIKNIESAADALISARRIILFGKGNSSAVAFDLQHKLLRIGLAAEMYADSHLQYVVAANSKPPDVIFAVSHSGDSESIIDAIKIAKNNNVPVITLTRYARSSLYDLADIRLCTAFEEVPHPIIQQVSRIAEYMIIDVLYRVIVHKNHNRVHSAYINIKNALNEK